MTLDSYRATWQAQSGPERPAAHQEELMTWIRERSAALDRRIRLRDIGETAAAAVLVLAFGYELLTTDAWLARLGAAVLIAASVLIVWRLRRARLAGGGAGTDASVADRLRAQRRQVSAQIALLESVLWWYLAPLGLGLTLFALGLDVAPWHSALLILAMLALYGFIWRLNQRAVRRDLLPRREALDRMLDEIARQKEEE